ncbi:MAG: hypothetical protein ACFHW5_06795 [Verrucomicrobiota bacterium]
MKKFFCTFLSLFWVTQVAGQTINYQGRLTDAGGEPVNDTVNVSLKIYDSETEGAVVYTEDVGEIEVVSGLYSFNFGLNGKSIANSVELIGTGDGEVKVFNYTTYHLPIDAEIELYDGLFSWSNVGGASDAGQFIGSVNIAEKSVTGIYIASPPPQGRNIYVAYQYTLDGITGALTDHDSSYLEVSINNTKLRREKIADSPISVFAKNILRVNKKNVPINIVHQGRFVNNFNGFKYCDTPAFLIDFPEVDFRELVFKVRGLSLDDNVGGNGPCHSNYNGKHSTSDVRIKLVGRNLETLELEELADIDVYSNQTMPLSKDYNLSGFLHLQQTYMLGVQIKAAARGIGGGVTAGYIRIPCYWEMK